MRLITIVENKIDIGDIFIFSDCNAFMISKLEDLYLATQLLNNGNRELGFVDYSDKNIYKLKERLCHDYGTPKNIVHMKDVNLSIF
jgi:hypothetical protein